MPRSATIRAVASSASASARSRRRCCGAERTSAGSYGSSSVDAAAHPLPHERRGSARAASRPAGRTSGRGGACRRRRDGGRQAGASGANDGRGVRAEPVTAVVRGARLGRADELPRPLHLDEHGRVAAGVGMRLAQPQPVGLAQRLLVDGRVDPEHLVGRGGQRDCRTRAARASPSSGRTRGIETTRERMPRHPVPARRWSPAASAASGPCRRAGRGSPRRGRGGVVANHITSPYSCASAARRSGSSRARRTAASVTARPVGESSPSRSAVADASASGRARSRSTISADGRRRRTRRRSTRARPRARDGAGVSSKSSTSSAGSGRIGARLERVAQRLEPLATGRSGRRSRRRSRPRHPSSAPVSPRYSPSRPGARPSSHVPPTSGVNPMRVSGMASFDRSVTTRSGGVAGEADAAAHRDAVRERDDGLRVLGDAGVEGVLGAEERAGALRIARADLLVEIAHVAAGAQTAIAGAVEQHDARRRCRPPTRRAPPRVSRIMPRSSALIARGRLRVSHARARLPPRTRTRGSLRARFGHDRNVTARRITRAGCRLVGSAPDASVHPPPSSSEDVEPGTPTSRSPAARALEAPRVQVTLR